MEFDHNHAAALSAGLKSGLVVPSDFFFWFVLQYRGVCRMGRADVRKFPREQDTNFIVRTGKMDSHEEWN